MELYQKFDSLSFWLRKENKKKNTFELLKGRVYAEAIRTALLYSDI